MCSSCTSGTRLGDGSTTALQPKHQDLQTLAGLIAESGARSAQRLDLGDTFDHLDLTWELTKSSVRFVFSTRPESEWASPPPWAPPPGEVRRVSVARAAFLDTWAEAAPQFRELLRLQ